MPRSVAGSDMSDWTVDRDQFAGLDHNRAAAIAHMQERLQKALLSKNMEAVTQTLLAAIELDSEDLEEAMLEVQAYMNRRENKDSDVPRFITE